MRDLFSRARRQRCSAANVSSKDEVKRECRSSTSSSRKVRSSERYSRRRVTERFDDGMFPPSKVPTNLTLRQSATRLSADRAENLFKRDGAIHQEREITDHRRVPRQRRILNDFHRTTQKRREVQLHCVNRLPELVRCSDILREPAD